jgi:hypothetical protein
MVLSRDDDDSAAAFVAELRKVFIRTKETPKGPKDYFSAVLDFTGRLEKPKDDTADRVL